MYQKAQADAAAAGDGAGPAADSDGAASSEEDVVDAEVVDEGKS
jgi:hypothetical protein